MSRFDPSLIARALASLVRPVAEAVPAEPWDPVVLAAALCRRFEGLRLSPYLCPAGVPTIGFGATRYENGRAVRLSDLPITRERAEALLQWQLRAVVLPAVLRLCPGVQGAGLLAALMDFVFNLGEGRLAASTLRRRVNAGELDLVPAELRKWVYSKGRKLAGLVARREAAIALIEGA